MVSKVMRKKVTEEEFLRVKKNAEEIFKRIEKSCNKNESLKQSIHKEPISVEELLKEINV